MKNNSQKAPRGALVAIGLMTAMMPIEVFIEKLEKTLTAYKVVSNEETKNELLAAMAGMSMKFKSEGKDPVEFMKELSDIESEGDMINNLKNIGAN